MSNSTTTRKMGRVFFVHVPLAIIHNRQHRKHTLLINDDHNCWPVELIRYWPRTGCLLCAWRTGMKWTGYRDSLLVYLGATVSLLDKCAESWGCTQQSHAVRKIVFKLSVLSFLFKKRRKYRHPLTHYAGRIQFSSSQQTVLSSIAVAAEGWTRTEIVLA